MNKVMEIFKKILETILNYLKSILTALSGFFLDMFKNGTTTKELKPVKLNNDNKEKLEKVINDTSGFNENPISRSIFSSDFKVNLEDLEKLIIEEFCEELELEEEKLTKNENDFIKDKAKKIIPILQDYKINKTIFKEEDLVLEIKKLVKEELEIQFKLEQTKKIDVNNLVIIPLIKIKKAEPNYMPSSKPSFLDTKIDKIIEKKKEETIINIPSNNIIGLVPPSPSLDPEPLTRHEDNYETLFRENLDINENNSFSPNLDVIDSNKKEVFTGNKKEITFMPNINIKADTITNNEVTLMNTDNLDIENKNIENEVLENNYIVEVNKEEVQENKINIINEEEIDYETYDLDKVDTFLNNLDNSLKEEIKKEDFEEKNYELLEQQIDNLLKEIYKLKLKKLDPNMNNKLLEQEKKLINLKNNLSDRKQKDIYIENECLNANIMIDDLNALEEHLQRLHIENNIDLQNYLLYNIEELNNMTIEKAKKIEIELLKLKLKKAIHALEFPSLMALSFIRNKYFLFFTGGLFVNRHLKFFDAILKRKNLEFEPEELAHIKNGNDAFNDAILMSQQNLEYLNYLEIETFRKYPDLNTDIEYIRYLNLLKSKLLKQQEKLLKKEKCYQKNNLKLKKKIRKLKKKENLAS